MTELEKLKAQRDEIDKKIKQLTCPKYEVDGARLIRDSRRGEPLDQWRVTLQEIGGNTTQYKEVVFATTREDAVEGIYNLIYSLKLLADTVDEDGKIAKKMRGE